MNARRELEKLDQRWVEKSKFHRSTAQKQKYGVIAWVTMMMGFGLVFIGLWLDELGENVRLERLLRPWPIVAGVLGICIVLGSLMFIIRIARHLRAYNDARIEYESRRYELLQEIHASESD